MIKKFLAHIVISATLLVSGIAIACTPTQTSVKTQNTAITDTSKQPVVYKNKEQWLAKTQSKRRKKRGYNKTRKQKRRQKRKNKKPKKGNKGKG
jgi:hypothetical protein